MADVKISGLPASTTPLAGTEVLPIVQGGQTRQVSVNNLTAGKAVTASSLTATNLKTSPAAANLDISGTTIAAAGTDANIDININAKGTGVAYLNQRWGVNASGALVASANNTYDIGNGASDPRDISLGRNLLAGGTATASRFIPSGSTVATNGMYLPAANAVGFSTNSTAAFRIDASQNLLVNQTTTYPNFGKIQIRADSTAIPTNQDWSSSTPAGNSHYVAIPTATNSTQSDWLLLRGTYYGDSTTHKTGIVFQDFFRDNNQYGGMYAQATGGSLTFGTVTNGTYATTNASLSEAMRIQASRGISIGDTTDPGAGNLRLGTGNLVIGTSGKGIDFSINPNPAGMTSELLNDYEEGTFTPVLFGTTGAGTGTYTEQVGRYTKVGQQVTIQILLAWTAHTGTGNMQVSGLPFTSNANVSAPFTTIAYNLATGANTLLGSRMLVSNTVAELIQLPTGGGAWGAVAMDTNVDALLITGTYFV